VTAYVFRYDSGAGTLWERDFPLPSDEAARLEGELLLANQAVITPITGQAVSVYRVVAYRTRELVGTWIWSPAGAQWSAGADDALSEPITQEQA